MKDIRDKKLGQKKKRKKKHKQYVFQIWKKNINLQWQLCNADLGSQKSTEITNCYN